MLDEKLEETKSINANILDNILIECNEYVDNDKFVFKLCCDISENTTSERDWLVVLRKLISTRTNELRENVFDNKFAKFRGNIFMVVKIFNIHNTKTKKTFIVNKFCNKELKYEINTIVKSDFFGNNLNIICSTGVHYFKTVLACCYFYVDPVDIKYSGYWIHFHDDGSKESEGSYINGIKSGHWISYRYNEEKMNECDYVNGIIIGNYVCWCTDGTCIIFKMQNK